MKLATICGAVSMGLSAAAVAALYAICLSAPADMPAANDGLALAVAFTLCGFSVAALIVAWVSDHS